MRTSTNLLHPIAMGQKKGGHDELHLDRDALIVVCLLACLLVIRLMLFDNNKWERSCRAPTCVCEAAWPWFAITIMCPSRLEEEKIQILGVT